MKALPVLAALVLSHSAAAADTIDIKGIRLGMSQLDIQELHGTLPLRDFTIGGVRSKYSVSPDFLDGKMQVLRIFFDASGFDQVRSAVRTKYPDLACADSDVTNAMGTRFTQTECHLKGNDGILTLRRFSSTISTGSLSLISNEELDRLKREFAASKKDM